MGDFPSSVPKRSFGNLGPELHSASALLILTLTFHLGRRRRLCFSVYKSVTEDPKLGPPLGHFVVGRVSQATASNTSPSNSHQFSPLTSLPRPHLPAGHPYHPTNPLSAPEGEDGQS